MLSQTSSSRLHIHELLSLPATKALVSDLLYKVLLEARIRYASYLTYEALGSDLRYEVLREAHMRYAYATHSIPTHTLCIRYACATYTLRIRY